MRCGVGVTSALARFFHHERVFITMISVINSLSILRVIVFLVLSVFVFVWTYWCLMCDLPLRVLVNASQNRYKYLTDLIASQPNRRVRAWRMFHYLPHLINQLLFVNGSFAGNGIPTRLPVSRKGFRLPAKDSGCPQRIPWSILREADK